MHVRNVAVGRRGGHLRADQITGHENSWRPFLNALHPSGVARQVRVVGAAATWLPPQPPQGQPADVLLFAPTAAQCLAPGWLVATLTAAANAQSAEGILYVLLPRPWRRHATAILHRHGFETLPPIGHFGISASTQCHVQLRRAPLLYAFANLPIPRARLYLQLLKTLSPARNGTELLAALLPSVGLAASRPGTPPPFAWLLGSESSGTNGIVVATSQNASGEAATAFGFCSGARSPSVVAKIRRANGGLHDEAALLTQVGSAAQDPNVRIPKLIRRLTGDDDASFVETAIPGRPVALLLRQDPQQFTSVVEMLAAWLARWHRRTMTMAHLTPERQESEILLPARILIDELPRGGPYLDWLARRSDMFVRRPVPWVAAHNDLTMSNVLRDADGRLGIVDWEGAQPDGLPLSDFWYAACDALSAARGHIDRAAAFIDCFSRKGRFRGVMAGHETHLRQVFAPTHDWIDVCFHSCWLQHAMNERLRDPSGGRPFLKIAQALALRFDDSL